MFEKNLKLGNKSSRKMLTYLKEFQVLLSNDEDEIEYLDEDLMKYFSKW